MDFSSACCNTLTSLRIKEIFCVWSAALPYVFSSRTLYCSSPRPPSTSWSNFVISSFSNCKEIRRELIITPSYASQMSYLAGSCLGWLKTKHTKVQRSSEIPFFFFLPFQTCVRGWSCAHTASYRRRWGWWLSSAPAPAPAWPPAWARPWPGWTSFCAGLRDNKTLSHRNIGVWFEKAISCLFISQQTEDESNNVANKTTRLRETGQYKILSCYSPRITGRHWINYPTNLSDHMLQSTHPDCTTCLWS